MRKCNIIEITTDVLRTCLTHAHVTNAQEIAGLLLGEVEEVSKPN